MAVAFQADFADLQLYALLSTHSLGPNCIPTARNEQCYKDPLPGDDALYGMSLYRDA